MREKLEDIAGRQELGDIAERSPSASNSARWLPKTTKAAGARQREGWLPTGLPHARSSYAIGFFGVPIACVNG